VVPDTVEPPPPGDTTGFEPGTGVADPHSSASSSAGRGADAHLSAAGAPDPERSAAPHDSADLLAVGRVGRPHGLDGSFHVTQPRERVLGAASQLIVDGRRIEIVRHDGTPAAPILRLAGVSSREAVERLRGTDLWVPRAETPPLEEDEWLAEDLVGCRVVDGDTPVGVVAKVLAYPSCELLEVQRPAVGAKALLVPLIGDAVRTVDVEAKRIDVDLAFLGEQES
jgi:16S rRNA processing protein RimM